MKPLRLQGIMTGKMYFPNATLYRSSKSIKLSFILNHNMCEKTD